MKDGNLQWRNRNLTGQTFGALTALEVSYSDGKKLRWVFQCVECGSKVVKVGADVTKEVKRGGYPNCGCLSKALVGVKNTTHGMSSHPMYKAWAAMKARCSNPNHKAWENYGGRGITVCPEWVVSFQAFYLDMKNTYQHGLDIDRQDNNQGYNKQNCRWVDRQENCMNKRNTVHYINVPQLSKESGISRSTLYYRVRAGVPADQILCKPYPGNMFTTS